MTTALRKAARKNVAPANEVLHHVLATIQHPLAVISKPEIPR